MASLEVKAVHLQHFLHVDRLQDVINHQEGLLGLVVDLGVAKSE